MFWQDIEIKSESEGGVKGVGVTGMSTVLACKRLTGSNLQSETHFFSLLRLSENKRCDVLAGLTLG